MVVSPSLPSILETQTPPLIPTPWNPPFYTLSPALEQPRGFYLNNIVQYVVFYDWLTSLGVWSSASLLIVRIPSF